MILFWILTGVFIGVVLTSAVLFAADAAWPWPFVRDRESIRLMRKYR